MRRGGRWRFGGSKAPTTPRSTFSYAAAKAPGGRIGSDGVHYYVEADSGHGLAPASSGGGDHATNGAGTSGQDGRSSTNIVVTAPAGRGADGSRGGAKVGSKAGGGGPKTPASGRRGGKPPTSAESRKGRKPHSIGGLRASYDGSAERAAGWAAAEGDKAADGDCSDEQVETDGDDVPGASPQSLVLMSSPKKVCNAGAAFAHSVDGFWRLRVSCCCLYRFLRPCQLYDDGLENLAPLCFYAHDSWWRFFMPIGFVSKCKQSHIGLPS